MIRYETTFACPLPPATARGHFINWLQTIGYRLTLPPFLSNIAAERGSLMGNFATLNPRQWQVKLTGSFRPSETGSTVTLEWVVTTAGQTTTRADIQFWQMEIETCLKACMGYRNDHTEYQAAAVVAQRGDAWRGLALLVAILSPLIGALIWTSSLWESAVITTMIGVPSYMAFRAPRTVGEIPIPPPLEPTEASI